MDTRDCLKKMMIDEVGYDEGQVSKMGNETLIVEILEHLFSELKKQEDHTHTIY